MPWAMRSLPHCSPRSWSEACATREGGHRTRRAGPRGQRRAYELGRHDEALARLAAVVDVARRRGELEEALALEWQYAALKEAGREAEAMAAAERHEEIRHRLGA